MSSLALSLRFLQAQPDGRLVELARQGHELAFEALVRRYRKELLSYCRRLLPRSGNGEDAVQQTEDALQQTLLHAWRALHSGAEVRDVRPWLYRIAHNVSLNNLRVNVAVPHEPIDALGGRDLDQLVEERFQARAALAGIASLPALQRQVFVSATLDGASHEEVATALGLSSGAVRGLIYRARAIVRAAAAAITPSPVMSWAIRRAEAGSGRASVLAETIAGGGGAGMAAVIAKGGAVLTLAVAGAGGVILSHPAGHQRARPRTGRPSSVVQTALESRAASHAAGVLAELGRGISSDRRIATTRRVETGRATVRTRADSSSGERHGGSTGANNGGHDGASRGGSSEGPSRGSSGSSDRGSGSGPTVAGSGSGSDHGGRSGSSGSGSDGTSTFTTSGPNGGTSESGPGPGNGGQSTTPQTTSDGGSGTDGGGPDGSNDSSGSGDTASTSSPR